MTNRLEKLVGEPQDDRPTAGAFYEVIAGYETFYVARETAEGLFVDLASDGPARWIRFTDIHGSRICLRGRLVECVRESTEAQRAADRAFHRERRRERKADRRWDEDDDWS